MSVNITVNGNAIGEKPARPICGRNLAKEKSDEIERRRKLRLQQVREQSNKFAANIRQKVNDEKIKKLADIQLTKQRELESWKRTVIANKQREVASNLTEADCAQIRTQYDIAPVTTSWRTEIIEKLSKKPKSIDCKNLDSIDVKCKENVVVTKEIPKAIYREIPRSNNSSVLKPKQVNASQHVVETLANVNYSSSSDEDVLNFMEDSTSGSSASSIINVNINSAKTRTTGTTAMSTARNKSTQMSERTRITSTVQSIQSPRKSVKVQTYEESAPKQSPFKMVREFISKRAKDREEEANRDIGEGLRLLDSSKVNSVAEVLDEIRAQKSEINAVSKFLEERSSNLAHPEHRLTSDDILTENRQPPKIKKHKQVRIPSVTLSSSVRSSPTKKSTTTKVEYYDHKSHYSKEYVPRDNVVQRIDPTEVKLNSSERALLEKANKQKDDIAEKMKKTDERAQSALDRLRITRDRDILYSQLDKAISLDKDVNRPLLNLDTQIKTMAADRQKKLTGMFENILTKPVPITCDVKNKPTRNLNLMEHPGTSTVNVASERNMKQMGKITVPRITNTNSEMEIELTQSLNKINELKNLLNAVKQAQLKKVECSNNAIDQRTATTARETDTLHGKTIRRKSLAKTKGTERPNVVKSSNKSPSIIENKGTVVEVIADSTTSTNESGNSLEDSYHRPIHITIKLPKSHKSKQKRRPCKRSSLADYSNNRRLGVSQRKLTKEFVQNSVQSPELNLNQHSEIPHNISHKPFYCQEPMEGSSSSTVYLNLPETINVDSFRPGVDKKIGTANDRKIITSKKINSPRNMKKSKKQNISKVSKSRSSLSKEALDGYITRLLGMSRLSIEHLSLPDISDVPTPSESVVNVSNNLSDSQVESNRGITSDSHRPQNINQSEPCESKSSNNSKVQKSWLTNLKKTTVFYDRIQDDKRKQTHKMSQTNQEVLSPELLDYDSNPERIKIAEMCTKRIADLEMMIKKVREEKQRLFEATFSSNSITSTEYHEVRPESFNGNADQPLKKGQPIGESRDSGICISRPMTSCDMRDTPDALNVTPKPIVEHTDRVNETLKDTRDTISPVTPIRKSLDIHRDLSTIIEVDTPGTSRLNASLKDQETDPNLEYAKFPSFDEYAKKQTDDDFDFSSSLKTLLKLNPTGNDSLTIRPYNKPAAISLSDSDISMNLLEKLLQCKLEQTETYEQLQLNKPDDGSSSQCSSLPDIVSELKKRNLIIQSQGNSPDKSSSPIGKKELYVKQGVMWADAMSSTKKSPFDSSSSNNQGDEKQIAQTGIVGVQKESSGLADSSGKPLNLKQFLVNELLSRHSSSSNSSSLSSTLSANLIKTLLSSSSEQHSSESTYGKQHRTSTPVQQTTESSSQIQSLELTTHLFRGESRLSSVKYTSSKTSQSGESS